MPAATPEAPQRDPSRYSWLAHLPAQRKMLLVIGPLLVVFLLANLATLYSLQEQTRNRHWTEHTYRVLMQIGVAKQAILTAQLGARGYMLGQSNEELAAFEQGGRSLATGLGTLRTLTTDNPVQQARLDRIETLAARWQREIVNYVITPVSRGHTDAAARERLQRTLATHRTVTVADVMAVLNQMGGTEEALLSERSARLEHTLWLMRIFNALAAVLSLLYGAYVVQLTRRMVTRPLLQMTALMSRLAEHDHSIVVTRQGRRDEIGQIARALEVFKRMAIASSEQTWLKTEVSRLVQRLQEAATHHAFGATLTSEVAPLVKAGVALYYGYDAASERLDLLGSYGLRQSWNPAEAYVPGEGLVGQCVIERKPIALDEVPERYLRIHSGAGEASPAHVLILPVLFRERLVGVLELASFAPIAPLCHQFLDELLPIVGLTQENLNRAIATQSLLEQTSEQADHLRHSEEVLRQQQQGLRDANAALQTKTRQLEEQSQRLTVSEEELRVQTEELQASNEELREKGDILKQQKQTLEALQRDTAQKALELERASQYKSDFLANMSHELRTPLNSLLILSRSLADNDGGNLDEEQVESARIIHDAGANLLRLINDILDLSKIEAGKMELVIDELPLAVFARALKRTFAHVAQEKGLAFEVRVDEGMPPALHTDSARLEQVANNLLGNAFKFTARGGVQARIGRPAADVRIPPHLLGQPLVAIEVSDTGIGIAPEKFDRIFQAFEQVDAGTSRQYGGTGLGLAICKRIAALLGGDIVLRSTPGEGSTFTVLLPENAPAMATPPATMTSLHTPAPAPRAHSSALLPEAIEDDRARLAAGDTVILLVEDDPAFARILADMIRRNGHRVLAAADGESGLALAREHRPTGVLLDVMLPGMDGWTLMARLKGDEATRHIPVHFISATDEAGRGRELGAVGFLTKPVSRETINAALERLLHFAEGNTRRLLVVDDDAASRTAVRTMLRRGDVEIDEADSAEAALRMTGETTYDCIVLDLGLPGMSGMDLLEQLAATPAGVPPVVIYSGRNLSHEENLKLRQYTDAIVVKGARSPERLLDEVSLFLHSIRHAPRRAAEQPPPGNELKGRRVLLVDDDMRNLFALSKVMRGWGLAVTMAQDGHKALEALEDYPSTELVLMDIMMPGMDGYETMRAIRAQTGFTGLPIIALTAKAMRGDREKCLEAGASDYLSKPVDIGKLASLLRVWLPH
ncbi:response regulator [Frateuria soli]|uniref:response regulator n=1 Tax=Frateuria soli TaxID=1542730 RepID=UPI001E3607F0|nr:response regulator [Frateuria soli]UGB37531.1 response regulator [Frateuria soli]